MQISIELLSYDDLKDLYDFELANRTYFEELVPGRGDEYFYYETFMQKNLELLEEQRIGQSYFYLIKNKVNEILGRINLTDVDFMHEQAHIGYRVGASHIGKGIASHALQLLCNNIESLNINKLFAKTTTNNIGSQKVLEKNHFTYVSKDDESFEMNGKRVSFIYYVRQVKNMSENNDDDAAFFKK